MMFLVLFLVLTSPIDIQTDIVRFSNIKNATATYDIGRTKDYVVWNEKDGVVFFDDYGVKLKKCDSSDLLLCIHEPFPIFFPKDHKNNYIYQISGTNYLINTYAQRRVKAKKSNCYNDLVWLKVKNLENNDIFWYRIAKKTGLLQIIQFSNNEQNFSIPVANYTLGKGKALAYDEACSGYNY